MSFPDSDIVARIESKRIEPPGFDREDHELDCPCNSWKHPWRLSDCTCDGNGLMRKEDAEDVAWKGE